MAPTASRSATPSPVRSPSAASGAGLELKVMVVVPPTLPPTERLVTANMFVNRVGVMVIVALPSAAVTLPGGPLLSWYR